MALSLTGHLVYVADVTGLVVADISEPRRAAVVSALPLPGAARDVDVAGDLAFLACGDAGLQIVDVSDPAAPRRLAGLTLPLPARHVTAVGDHVLVADGGRTVHVVDVRDPRAPLAVNAVRVQDTVVGMAVAGDHAYVSDRWSVKIVEVVDPRMARVVGAFDTPGYVDASCLALAGDHLLMAGCTLRMAPLQCEAPTSLDPGDREHEMPIAGPTLSVHPNPVNPSTSITFALVRSGPAEVAVYDLAGRRVAVLASGTLAAGTRVLTWDGRDTGGRSLPSGTYVVRLVTEQRVHARKLTLIR